MVSIESSDRGLELGLGGSQCATWVRQLPHGHVRIFTDNPTRHSLPASCVATRTIITECCPGKANLSESIASAQYKRECLHQQMQHGFARGTWPPASARWIVSTEQDVWWNIPKLVAYLTAIESSYPEVLRKPALFGSWTGPFIIMNQRMMATLGDSKFMDTCRKQFIRCRYNIWALIRQKEDRACVRNKSSSASCERAAACRGMPTAHGLKKGAAYNNDHLLRFCAQRVRGMVGLGELDALSATTQDGVPRGDRFWPFHACNKVNETDSSFAVLFQNTEAHDPRILGWARRPSNLLAYHHVDGHGMLHLQSMGVHREDHRRPRGECLLYHNTWTNASVAPSHASRGRESNVPSPSMRMQLRQMVVRCAYGVKAYLGRLGHGGSIAAGMGLGVALSAAVAVMFVAH